MNSPDDQLPIDPDLDDGNLVGPGTVATAPPRQVSPDVVAMIALGGAIGTLARAALGQAFPKPAPDFPATTLVINLVGAFALSVVFITLIERFGPAERLRPFLTTGVIGGFTTFSTYMVEILELVRTDRVAFAAIYLLITVFGGLAATFAGIAVAHRLVRLPARGEQQ